MLSETELGKELACYRYSWLGRHRGVVISLRVIVFLVITAILVLLFDDNVEGGRSFSKIFWMVEFFLILLVGGMCFEMMFGVVKLFNDVVVRENGIEVVLRKGKRCSMQWDEINNVVGFDMTVKEKEGEISEYTKAFGTSGFKVLSSKGSVCVYRTIHGYDELKEVILSKSNVKLGEIKGSV